MRIEIPIGGQSQDFNSRRSRSDIVNAFIEFNKGGDFYRIRKAQGLKEYHSAGTGPIRGMFTISDLIFFVSGQEVRAIRVQISGSFVNYLLGTVSGYDSKCKFAANGTDSGQVMLIVDGDGYIIQNLTGTPTMTQITDVDYEGDYSIASLNQIFWVNKPNSNEFIGSTAADGLDWPALRFAAAEQSPDAIVYMAQKKSALWIMGEKTCEYWQTDITDTDVPVRPVLGATIERGVGAQKSVAEFQDSIFFLGDDYSVYQISGTGIAKISDIGLEYAIKGDGFKAGYDNVDDAEGFFIDHPAHKMYVLTFRAARVTWVYDLSTGLWHKRSSKNSGYWRARDAVIFGQKIIVGDYLSGTLFELDENTYTENGDDLTVEIVTPSLSGEERDLYVSYVEPNVEVGRGEATAVYNGVLTPWLVKPYLQLEYSKDGGVTYKAKRSLNIGQAGDRQKITRSYQFGRTKRGFNFVLRFRFTDNSPFFMYKIFAEVEKGG